MRLFLILLCFFMVLTGCDVEEAQTYAQKQREMPSDKDPKKSVQAEKANQPKQENPITPESNEQKKEPQPEEPLKKPEQVSASAREQEQIEVEKLKQQTLFYKGLSTQKRVALTFDDGPDRYYTLQILDILKKEKVPATFFVVGNLSKIYPDVLRRIDQEGHVIGNHSWNHPQFTKLSQSGINSQLSRTNAVIKEAIGKEPRLFRPPYGAMNTRVEKQIGSQGYKIIQWSVDTRDWSGRSSKQIVNTVINQVEPGGIILQHSAGGEKLRTTVEALPQIISYLKKNGYEFVTVDELLYVPAYFETSR